MPETSAEVVANDVGEDSKLEFERTLDISLKFKLKFRRYELNLVPLMCPCTAVHGC